MSSNVRERKKSQERGGVRRRRRRRIQKINSLFRNKGCVSVTLWPCHIYITKGMYVS